MRDMLIVVIKTLFLALAFLIVLFAIALVASAQEAEEKVSLELTEVETLQLSIMMKDALIASQRIQILQAQFQTLSAQRNARQAEIRAMVERLRVTHEAPADKFTFNEATLAFVPIPPKEPEKVKGDED